MSAAGAGRCDCGDLFDGGVLWCHLLDWPCVTHPLCLCDSVSAPNVSPIWCTLSIMSRTARGGGGGLLGPQQRTGIKHLLPATASVHFVLQRSQIKGRPRLGLPCTAQPHETEAASRRHCLELPSPQLLAIAADGPQQKDAFVAVAHHHKILQERIAGDWGGGGTRGLCGWGQPHPPGPRQARDESDRPFRPQRPTPAPNGPL